MSARHQKLEAIFDAALPLSAAEREVYLTRLCADDPELKDQVERLLRASDQVGQFLTHSPAASAPGLGAQSAPPPEPALADPWVDLSTIAGGGPLLEGPGTLIGRYKLLEKLGEGGFGAVYVAEQREPVKRRVALKLIKLGMDTKQVVARFEAERQALALMDHPHIAKVLDAGATETGRPYFVMELVRGVPITRYCDESNLSTGDRLKLFIQVCQAIQHAHQKGIIHRDIKPSNILVTLHDGVAVPKVIDFGIAKATQGELTDITIYTQFQQFIGTPAYMSPEQAEMSGLDIDTRSDIYSLGVLLYELLVGKTPFDAKELMQSGLDEMRRTIREKEPARPSTRLSSMVGEELTTAARSRGSDAARLIHVLRGDLDWIVMKALEKDRARRYETANALAMDIQRHLGNEPVMARPPSAVYRVQKAFRRNKVVFTAASAVALALLFGLAGSTWQAALAVRARKQAEASERRAVEAREAESLQRETAILAQARAEASENKVRSQAYEAAVALGLDALNEGHLGRARELLASAKEAAVPRQLTSDQGPLAGSPGLDLRGWEWRYLWAQTRGDDLFTLGQHQPMAQVALWLDNRRAVSAGKDGRVIVWDVENRRPLAQREYGSRVNGLARSRDGSVIAIGLGNQSLSVLKLDTWQPLWSITNTHAIGHLVFSPDGRRLAVGGGGRTSLLSAHDGSVQWSQGEAAGEDDVFKGGPGFSPDGRFLACRVWTRAGLRVVDLDRNEQRDLTKAQGGPALAMEFSPDGKTLALGDNDGVTVFSWPSGETITNLSSSPRHVACLAFSPDGLTLASAGGDQTIRLFDTRTWHQIAALRGHEFEIWSVAYSPDGQRLLSGAKDDTVRVWSTHPRPAGRGWSVHPDRLRVGAWPQGNGWCGLVTDGSRYRLYELPTGDELVEASFPEQLGTQKPTAFEVVAPHTVALGFADGRLVAWNVASHSAAWVATNNYGSVAYIAGTAGGRGIAVAYEQGIIELRRPNGAPEFHLTDSPMQSRARFWTGLAISRDGNCLASGAPGAMQVSLWDLTRREQRLLDLSHREGLLAMTLSDDGRFLVTTSYDAYASLWDVKTRVELHRFGGTPVGFNSAAFSPDQSRVALLSGGTDLSVWAVASGARVATLPRADHRSMVSWSLAGDTLAMVGREEGLRLWPAPSWEQVEAGTRQP